MATSPVGTVADPAVPAVPVAALAWAEGGSGALLVAAGEEPDDEHPARRRSADATRYTPDFLVELPGGLLELHEVKGFWRDDARVKFKVAAELFPMFRFVAVKRKHRQWELSYPGRA